MALRPGFTAESMKSRGVGKLPGLLGRGIGLLADLLELFARLAKLPLTGRQAGTLLVQTLTAGTLGLYLRAFSRWRQRCLCFTEYGHYCDISRLLWFIVLNYQTTQ